MESTTVNAPGTVALEPPSTVLNPETVSQSGGGAPNLTEPKDEGNKPQSIEDVLEAESKRLRDADAEAEKDAKAKADDATKQAKEKADAELKKGDAEKKADEKPAQPKDEKGRFAKAEQPVAKQGEPEEAAAERSAPEARQSEGRKHAEPPARFLPEARTKWANVPNEVKAEVHRVAQEYEAEIQRHKVATERYESVRQYDEMARVNGRELKDSLAKVVQIEQHIARDPIGALDTILREIGPRKADGSPVSLYEVARVVVEQGPQAMQRAALPQTQQSPNDPKLSALENELNALKTQMATASLTPMLEKFASEHPDYHGLEERIVEVLTSGIIERLYGEGLSPEQKLREAYRMAGGSAPSQSEPLAEAAHPVTDTARPVNPDAGKKSVRGAPSNGADTTAEENETDIREMLRKEMRKLSA